MDLDEWKADLKKTDIDDCVKNQRIQKKAEILKLEALGKEKVLNVKKNNTTNEEVREVNELLFESLEAKLSLLNQFNDTINS